MRRFQDLREIPKEKPCHMHTFKIVPRFSMEVGYLLYAHPNITYLTARTAEIEDYIATYCLTEKEMKIELTSGEKRFGYKEKIVDHVIKVLCHREHVNKSSHKCNHRYD